MWHVLLTNRRGSRTLFSLGLSSPFPFLKRSGLERIDGHAQKRSNLVIAFAKTHCSLTDFSPAQIGTTPLQRDSTDRPLRGAVCCFGPTPGPPAIKCLVSKSLVSHQAYEDFAKSTKSSGDFLRR